MIISWYADEITHDRYESHDLWNRYLEQHIPVNEHGVDHFARHPQLDHAIFNYSTCTHEFRSFNSYIPGKNIVIVSLHGGWHVDKLRGIKTWFLSNKHRAAAFRDINARIIIDYSEEGFTTEVFDDLQKWLSMNHLEDRVLFVCSSINVSQEYRVWCVQNRQFPILKTAWYGFFTNWVLRDRIMCRNTNNIVTTSWNKNDHRYMCLNRRPHPHRILLLAMLEHANIIDKGAVSMPLHFDEIEVVWESGSWDLNRLWNRIIDAYNGYADYLIPAYKKMHSRLPLIADTDNFAINRALDLNDEYYSRFPINVVSETLFFSTATFASEKIWKPMVVGQIFMVMAAPGYLADLRSLGFKTFSPWINEDYDTIEDHLERAAALVDSLNQVANLDHDDFCTLLKNCSTAIEHNRRLITDPDHVDRLVSTPVIRAIEQLWDE